MKINARGQHGLEKYSFEFKDSKKARRGVTAFITDLELSAKEGADVTIQLFDDDAPRFEREMCSAPADADLDAICEKYFEITVAAQQECMADPNWGFDN